MKQRHRIYYSVAQRPEIWDQRQAGVSMSSIGDDLIGIFSVCSVISPTGGIRLAVLDPEKLPVPSDSGADTLSIFGINYAIIRVFC